MALLWGRRGAEAVKLGNGLAIRPPDEGERVRLEDVGLTIDGAGVVVDHRREVRGGAPADDHAGLARIRDVVLALRLDDPAPCGASIIWIGAGGEEPWGRGGLWVVTDGADARTVGEQDPAEIGAGSGPGLRRLLRALERSRGRYLSLVLERFDAVYARGPAESRLVDLWFGLEVLILPDHPAGPRSKAALRLAWLLGDRPGSRARIFDLVVRSWDARARVLRRRRDVVELEELVEETRMLLRAAIRVRLLEPPSGGVLGLDRLALGNRTDVEVGPTFRAPGRSPPRS